MISILPRTQKSTQLSNTNKAPRTVNQLQVLSASVNQYQKHFVTSITSPLPLTSPPFLLINILVLLTKEKMCQQ